MIEGYLCICFSAERREMMNLPDLAVGPATELLMQQAGAASIPEYGIKGGGLARWRLRDQRRRRRCGLLGQAA